MKPLSRTEILALGPVITLPVLGQILNVSEPVIRQQARSGHLDEIGIRTVKLGVQTKVITASVWAFLGLDHADGAGIESAPRRPARQGRATASALRPVRGERC
jgi:hypothetical protein